MIDENNFKSKISWHFHIKRLKKKWKGAPKYLQLLDPLKKSKSTLFLALISPYKFGNPVGLSLPL